MESARPEAIIVSECQRNNPVLACVRNVPLVYAPQDAIKPDYVLGRSTCALYISLRFHQRKPEYLLRRIRELGQDFRLRVVLALVDQEDNAKLLQSLNQMCLLYDCTLVLAWSLQEAARYLETFKAYENKSASSIQEKTDTDYLTKVSSFMTCVKGINRSDVVTLLDALGTVAGVCGAKEEHLALCPGMGEKKVKRLMAALHQPFKKAPQSAASDEGLLFEDTGADADV